MVTLQARFDEFDRFRAALARLKESSNVNDYTAYGPTNLDEVADLMPRQNSPVRITATAGAVIGLLVFWTMCWTTSLIYALIVGGKPPWVNVPFVVPTYEGTILVGSIFAFLGAILFARLDVRKPPPDLDRFTGDSYGIRVCCAPSECSVVRAMLEECGAEEVREL